MVTGSAELAATQTEQWDRSRMLATDLQDSLQNMKEGEIAPLISALVSMQGQIVSEASQLKSVDSLKRSSKSAMN